MFCPGSSRRWCWSWSLGEWHELLLGESLLHLQWSADRVHTTAAQWTDHFLQPSPSSSTSSHTAEPSKVWSALTRTEPHLSRTTAIFLLIIWRLTPDLPPEVTAYAHSCCQVRCSHYVFFLPYCIGVEVKKLPFFYLSHGGSYWPWWLQHWTFNGRIASLNPNSGRAVVCWEKTKKNVTTSNGQSCSPVLVLVRC